MTQPTRPKGCPLFLHRNGQWCKKVNGKPRYFGTDLDAALKRWADEKDHLLAGYEPPRADGKHTLAELCNLYLDDSRRRVASGEVRGDHAKRCEQITDLLINSLGKQAKPELLAPQHWFTVREALFKTSAGKQAAPNYAKLRISQVKAFLAWCERRKLVKLVDVADAFASVPKRQIRLAKAERGSRQWKASDLRLLINSAPIDLKAVLLLGINAAMGAADIAELRRSQWKPGQEVLHCPRNKTGIDRRVWLWPETREALAAAVAKRATPAKQAYDNRLLLTATNGLPWHRVENDVAMDLVRRPLINLKARLKITSDLTFYDCRRTFRTVASEVCDLEATNLCMGHVGKGEGATYLQGISDDRIRRVCEHVRTWLYGSEVSQ